MTDATVNLSRRRGLRLRPGGNLVTFGLLLPGLVFILLMFVWPIVSMLARAVYSPELERALPATILAMADWNGEGLPPDAVAQALLGDLRGIDRARAADAGRRLNYEIPGFRTLLLKTVNKGDPAKGFEALRAIDARWDDPSYWRAIRRASPVLTSYYLLTALDFERREDGGIGAAPAERALFVPVLVRTLWISTVVTLTCLLLAFPVAYAIASAPRRRQAVLMLLVLLPFWTSLLVRSSAWVILLQDNGLLNMLMIRLGIITEPVRMIFNRTGVYIALIHVMLPFMVLPLCNAMRAVPGDYVRAAFSLGASAPRTLLQVYLPQVWPGIAAGSLLTFVICVGYYVTPLLVGGTSDQMLSYFVAFYTNQTVNWGLASALAVVLSGLMLVLLGLYALIPRRGGLTARA